MTTFHYACPRCGHRIEAEEFHREYGYLPEHSIVYCRRECWLILETMNIAIQACYMRSYHSPTSMLISRRMPVPVGRRMIQI